MNFWTGYTMVK